MLILGITIFYKKPLPRWIVLVVAAICFLCASVRIWTTENKKYQEEIKIEEDKNEPKLSATLDFIAIAPGRTPDDSIVTAWMTIRNVGAQSIAENFTLMAATPNGVTSRGEFVSPPPTDNGHVRLGSDQPLGDAVLLLRKDSLAIKASEAPIPHNGEVTGYLMYYVAGIGHSDLNERGSTIELEFADALGKSYKASRTMNGPGHLPLDIYKLQH